MCLAFQHFDFNSADWISDNLHVISSWYLRTMGKEFIFRFSRRSWGRNEWQTTKNVCVEAILKSSKVCLNPHNTGTRTNGSVECLLITQYTIKFTFRFCSSCLSLNAVCFAFFLATVQARRGRWLWWYRHVRTSLIALITTLVLLYNPRKCNQIHTPMFQRERAFVPQPSLLSFC